MLLPLISGDSGARRCPGSLHAGLRHARLPLSLGDKGRSHSAQHHSHAGRLGYRAARLRPAAVVFCHVGDAGHTAAVCAVQACTVLAVPGLALGTRCAASWRRRWGRLHAASPGLCARLRPRAGRLIAVSWTVRHTASSAPARQGALRFTIRCKVMLVICSASMCSSSEFSCNQVKGRHKGSSLDSKAAHLSACMRFQWGSISHFCLTFAWAKAFLKSSRIRVGMPTS